jgi:hypothetical protein
VVSGACRECSKGGYHDLYVADQSVRFWTVALAEGCGDSIQLTEYSTVFAGISTP